MRLLVRALMTNDQLFIQLRDAARCKDKSRFTSLTDEGATFCFKHASAVKNTTFSESQFDAFISALHCQDIFDYEDSYHILLRFEADWSCLSVNQRDRLLTT